MQSFNHVAGGFAFTGLFCSFADVNIFERFDTMGVVWVACVLPDIDHTKSISGKIVYPLAKWIQTKYGHRTITHSLAFFVAVVCIVKGLDNLFHLEFTLPFALALSSHLIFDMCTLQGIPVFYPFSRKIAVIPSNPKLRLRSSDYQGEAIIFVLFCCLNVFSYPLMAAGFWSKYNKSLATWDTFDSERKRRPGDYEATFITADSETVRALVVDHNKSKIVVWHKGRFRVFDEPTLIFIDFQKVKSKHEIKTVHLLAVSVDSLNTYMKLPVVKVTAQSTNEIYFFDGPIMNKGTELTQQYPNGQKFAQLAIDNRETIHRLELLTAHYNQERKVYGQKLSELSQIQQELSLEINRLSTSDYDEGERRQRIIVLNKKLADFVQPIPPSTEVYKAEKAMLEIKLKEVINLNATILIWQAQEAKN